MAGIMLILALAGGAGASEHIGTDEFGRRCALRLNIDVAVMIEDEWFVGRLERPDATALEVHSRIDRTVGALDFTRQKERVTGFTLRLPSATGYEHRCSLTE